MDQPIDLPRRDFFTPSDPPPEVCQQIQSLIKRLVAEPKQAEQLPVYVAINHLATCRQCAPQIEANPQFNALLSVVHAHPDWTEDFTPFLRPHAAP